MIRRVKQMMRTEIPSMIFLQQKKQGVGLRMKREKRAVSKKILMR